MTKIGILGGAGRMGRMLIREVRATEGAALAGVSEAAPAWIGRDVGMLLAADPFGMAIGGDARALFEASDVVIDFTTPLATLQHAALAKSLHKGLVVGTTGLTPEIKAAIADAAKHTAIVHSANMSLGVNILTALTEKLATALGSEFDIEILEMHHRHKVDAPSGTALALGEAAARGRAVNLATVARHTRDGQVGARPKGEIGFAALRGGDVVGDHTVIFAAEGERIELTHKASSREIFARGAVRAALWLKDRAPGLYAMADVLGLG